VAGWSFRPGFGLARKEGKLPSDVRIDELTNPRIRPRAIAGNGTPDAIQEGPAGGGRADDVAGHFGGNDEGLLCDLVKKLAAGNENRGRWAGG